MKTINILLTEMANEIDKSEVENVKPKSKEWIESKDRLLVQILKEITKAKK